MNLRALLLRLHRWVALIFALPLLAIILSGLVLSIEPLAQKAPPASPLSRETVLGWLDRFDPQKKATGLALRTYDQTLTITGVGEDGAIDVSLASGVLTEEDGFAEWFGLARGLHERLLLDLGWLVTASTVAMLLLVGLGLAMGWPRLRNTLGGWHAGIAWIGLPLIVLSPLTGLLIAAGVTLSGPSVSPRGERIPVRDAVEAIAARQDLAGLTSLRTRGGRMIARIYEGGRLTNYVVTRDGVQPAPSNWPRALHEGNWNAFFGSFLNVVLSFALIGLWGTGLIIWARRRFRRRRPSRRLSPATAASR